MREFHLAALDGAHPSGWLAAVGLCALLDGSRLRFDEHHAPVLCTDADQRQAVERIVAGLAELTHPDTLPWERSKAEQSCTPPWRFLNPLAERSWDEPVVDALLRPYRLGVAKTGTGGKLPTDPSTWQAPKASLLLIGSLMYLRATVTTLWATPGAADGFRADVTALLQGGDVSVTRAKGFFYTSTELSPWTRGGSDEAWVQPALELLCLVGACQLLPEQKPAAGSTARAGLSWCLNPVALDLAGLVGVHELGHFPASWVRATCDVRPIPGSPYFNHFTDIHLVEP